MKNSPLQLEDYLVKDLQFSLLHDLKDVPQPGEYDELSIEVKAETKKRGGKERSWRCQLAVSSRIEEGKKYPYSFRIEYVGFFRVIDDFPAEYIDQMVKTNAPAVLYSSAREALMYITGRGRLTAVLLPSVTFLEPPPKVGAKKARSSKAIIKARKK